MILGLSSYTYGWAIGVDGHPPACPMNEQDLLDRCHRHRVSLVQICDNLPLNRLSSDRLTAFAERAARDGIAVEVGSRGLALAHATEMIALARRVGARLIRFVIDGPNYHPEPRQVIDLLRQLVPSLDGLTLGIENHDRLPARGLRSILEAVDSGCVGVCLDTANSLGAGEGLACVVRELAPFTVNLHLKDFQIARVPHLMGFTVEGRPAGAGMVDVPWLLEQLAPYGRCETAVLELWTPPEANLASTIAREENWVEQSLNYLKPLFKARA